MHQYYQDNKERLNLKIKKRRKEPGRKIYYRELEYYRKHPDQLKHTYLLRKYGITFDEYNTMFNAQEGRCLICGKHQSELNQALCVDHNHNTNAIRGLLCIRCNTGLGCFNDRTDLLTKAVEFLTNNSK